MLGWVIFELLRGCFVTLAKARFFFDRELEPLTAFLTSVSIWAFLRLPLAGVIKSENYKICYRSLVSVILSTAPQ